MNDFLDWFVHDVLKVKQKPTDKCPWCGKGRLVQKVVSLMDESGEVSDGWVVHACSECGRYE